jgi:methyl acetate hydrolase
MNDVIEPAPNDRLPHLRCAADDGTNTRGIWEDMTMTQMADVDAALRRATDAGEIAGVVAIATTAKEVIYQNAFGRRAIDTDIPMTPDGVFWLASMTKAIVAAAAMQLVEQGKLTLDAPIGTLLPQLANCQVLEGFAPDGAPRLRPAKRAITLRHLMTHTAGFCYNTWNPTLARYMERTGLPSARTGLDQALGAPLLFDPGERFEYGISIDWVGKAVEAASGQRLDAYLQDHIFAPLGMADTGFRLSDAQRARRVTMHQRGADGALTPIPFETAPDPEFFGGGGALWGTAPDYIRFVRMLLNGGALDVVRVLKPETVRLMGENHIDELVFNPLRSVLPAASNDFNPWPDQPAKWGLSFLINQHRTAEGRSAGSLAWAGLANTWFWIDPVRDVGGVIMMQLLPFVDRKAIELFAALERGVYAALGDTQRAA